MVVIGSYKVKCKVFTKFIITSYKVNSRVFNLRNMTINSFYAVK